jgi:hypothetical protein
MKEMTVIGRHVREGEEHVARMAARIEELKGLGLTQAANEKRVTLMDLRRTLATDRDHLRRSEGK